MEKTKLERLIEVFEYAKRTRAEYVGIVVKMDGFETNEVIINHYNNIESKLEYYKNTYDENLNHKYSKGISIINFSFDNEIGLLAEFLECHMVK